MVLFIGPLEIARWNPSTKLLFVFFRFFLVWYKLFLKIFHNLQLNVLWKILQSIWSTKQPLPFKLSIFAEPRSKLVKPIKKDLNINRHSQHPTAHKRTGTSFPLWSCSTRKQPTHHANIDMKLPPRVASDTAKLRNKFANERRTRASFASEKKKRLSISMHIETRQELHSNQSGQVEVRLGMTAVNFFSKKVGMFSRKDVWPTNRFFVKTKNKCYIFGKISFWSNVFLINQLVGQ